MAEEIVPVAVPLAIETPVEPAKKELDSAKFAALARRERDLVGRDLDLKKKQQEYDAKIKEYDDYQNFKKSAKLDPLKAIESLGLSYEEITGHMLNGNKPTTETKVEELERQLKEFQEGLTKKERDALEADKEEKQKQADRYLEEFKGELNSFIDSTPEEYDLINLYDQKEEVLKVIQANLEKTGKILSNKEAADLVKDYLLEMTNKGVATKAYQAKYGATSPAPQAGDKKQEIDSATAKSLSNSLTANAGTSLLPPKTERERMERALAALSKTK